MTRSRRKYHSVVTRAGYSVFKVPPTCPGISKAGRRDRRAFSESPDTVLLDGCPGFFEHPLPYASGFGIDGFVVRLSTSRPGVYRTSSRLTRPNHGRFWACFYLFSIMKNEKIQTFSQILPAKFWQVLYVSFSPTQPTSLYSRARFTSMTSFRPGLYRMDPPLTVTWHVPFWACF